MVSRSGWEVRVGQSACPPHSGLSGLKKVVLMGRWRPRRLGHQIRRCPDEALHHCLHVDNQMSCWRKDISHIDRSIQHHSASQNLQYISIDLSSGASGRQKDLARMTCS